jgi:hypothetical protein
MSLFRAFLTLIGLAILAAGGPSVWWAYMPVFALAGLSVWSTARVLRSRRALALEVTPYSVSIGRVAITRNEVAGVRRYSELMFKGVRIDLVDGRWLGIPHHHHHPTRVLRVLRSRGYPVAE